MRSSIFSRFHLPSISVKKITIATIKSINSTSTMANTATSTVDISQEEDVVAVFATNSSYNWSLLDEKTIPPVCHKLYRTRYSCDQTQTFNNPTPAAQPNLIFLEDCLKPLKTSEKNHWVNSKTLPRFSVKKNGKWYKKKN